MTDTPTTESTLVRPGIYARGSDTVDAILKAALHVLIEEGAAAFTLRRIATECGLKVGNVSRHFPRKEMLVQVLLEELLMPTESLMKGMLSKPGITVEAALQRVITGTLDDIGQKRITNLFTELWAMANHNEFIADRIDAVYDYVHRLIGSLVSQLNPALGPTDVEVVALYINATMEGTTMLAGYGKRWQAHMPQLKTIAVRTLINLVKTITPDEIQSLAGSDGAS